MLNQVSATVAVEPKSVAGLCAILVKEGLEDYDGTVIRPDLFSLKVVLKSGAHFKCTPGTFEEVFSQLVQAHKTFPHLLKISPTVFVESRSVAGINVVITEDMKFALKVVMKSGAHFITDPAVNQQEAINLASLAYRNINRDLPD
jgi:hypothetical protein